MRTRLVSFLSSITFAACLPGPIASGTAGPAEEPRIVSSIPADGADDVPLALGRIMIVFDRDMKENSWSLIEHAHLPFPPAAGEEAASWLDGRTFVLKLDSLEPGTTYAVQLNSDRRKGFMSAAGFVPLPTTVITFTTASGEAARTESPPAGLRATPGIERRPPPERTASRGTQPAPRSAQIRPGWEFRVTCTTAFKGAIQTGSGEIIFQEVAGVEFLEQVMDADGPLITKARREVGKAEIKGRDPETGEPYHEQLLPEGSAYTVNFGPRETRVVDAETGRAAGDPAPDLVGVPLTFDLWPAEKMKTGQTWRYEGQDLARRLRDLDVRGGRLELKVDRIATGPVGLRTAYLKGRFEGPVDLDGRPAEFSAAVQIDLPLDVGVPFMLKFEGPVRMRLEQFDEWTGEPVAYVLDGEMAFLQVTEPAAGVVDDVGGRSRRGDGQRPSVGPGGQRQPAPPQRRRPPPAGEHRLQPREERPEQDQPPPAGRGKPEEAEAGLPPIAFHRVNEPRENAFSILVPDGWRTEGGIFRVNAAEAGGPLNAIEAKIDIAFKRDEGGTVMLHRLPDIVYAHVGIGAGAFPPGSVYQGAQVMAILSAEEFLQALLPNLRPRSTNVRFLEVRKVPELVRVYREACGDTNTMLTQIGGPQAAMSFDAAGALVEYTEDGVRYRELLVTAIVDMPAAFIWGNKDTLAFRAPATEFERWRPVLDIMRYSVQLNPRWVMAEAGGQRERCDIVLETQREIHRISREIAENRRRTNEEINYENYLVLTGQEDFVNPYTNEVERDTNEYRYRWVTPDGHYYFTNREDDDPNLHMPFNHDDFKRTPVRPR
ncbi:MAG: Ig-like domain-containing protein [Planctomycetota bacterium]|nr:Ig-like domain-containing protein [Planctomycetota bacterium]